MTADSDNSDNPRSSNFASALRDGRSHLRLWIVAAAGLWVDLWSKAWAFSTLDADHPMPVWEGFMEFRRSLNAGAVFGFGAGLVWVFIVASFAALGFVLFLFNGSTPRQRILHAALGMILAGALGNLYDRVFVEAHVVKVMTEAGQVDRHIGRVVETGPDGSVWIGSWPEGHNPRSIPADQIIGEPTRQGVVRDFIKFLPRLPTWIPLVGGFDAWPWIFNVADALLVCGVAILLLNLWFTRGPTPSTRRLQGNRRGDP